jgi:DNA invertase Pin-like site-specific DNA recombinase
MGEISEKEYGMTGSSSIYGYIWMPTLNDDDDHLEKLFLKEEEYLRSNFSSSNSNNITKFYRDHCSIQLATFSRPELSSLRKTMKSGDIILVKSLAQITKTPNEMLSLFTQFKELGVQLISFKESFEFPSNEVLTTSCFFTTKGSFANVPSGRLALVSFIPKVPLLNDTTIGTFGNGANDANDASTLILKFLEIISNFEKVILNERRLQGIKNAKKAGRYKVTKTKRSIPSEFLNFYKLYMDRSNKFTLRNFEEKTGLTRSRIYSLFKQIKTEYGTSILHTIVTFGVSYNIY